MTSDISVQKTAYQVENRSWLLGPHGTEDTPSVTLDISKFTAGTHFPNGYIPSGTVLGKVTATGRFGPYTTGGSDGTETAVGILFSNVRVTNDNGVNKTTVGGAILVHGFIKESRLPFQSGAGSLDTAGEADLKLIHVTA